MALDFIRLDSRTDGNSYLADGQAGFFVLSGTKSRLVGVVPDHYEVPDSDPLEVIKSNVLWFEVEPGIESSDSNYAVRDRWSIYRGWEFNADLNSSSGIVTPIVVDSFYGEPVKYWVFSPAPVILGVSTQSPSQVQLNGPE